MLLKRLCKRGSSAVVRLSARTLEVVGSIPRWSIFFSDKLTSAAHAEREEGVFRLTFQKKTEPEDLAKKNP